MLANIVNLTSARITYKINLRKLLDQFSCGGKTVLNCGDTVPWGRV